MKFLSPKTKKVIAIISAVVVSLMSFCCFALAGSTDPVTSPADLDGDEAVSAAQTLFNDVAGVLNFANIAKVLGIGIAAVIGIWLAWWGLRKLVRMLVNVLQRGKLSL